MKASRSEPMGIQPLSRTWELQVMLMVDLEAMFISKPMKLALKTGLRRTHRFRLLVDMEKVKAMEDLVVLFSMMVHSCKVCHRRKLMVVWAESPLTKKYKLKVGQGV